MTISEIAEQLGIAPNTVKQRLFQAGIKPKTKEAIYDPAVVEQIRNVRMGRPRKADSDKK